MPSMRTWPAACAGPCTARPASGWPRPGHQPCRSPSTWPAGRRPGDTGGGRMAGQGGPPGGAAVTRCRRGSAGPGGRADGTWGSRPRPPARRTGQQPDVGRAHRRRRNGLPLLLDRDLDPSLEGAVRVCLGHALLSAGRARDSLCELERACQSPLLTGAERAEAQAWASFARLRLLDLDGAAAAAGEARSAAVSARDHARHEYRHGLARRGF